MTAADLDQAMAKYEGDFLEVADIMHGPPRVVEIADVDAPNTKKDAQGKLIDKPILTFAKARKKFILNKTNERLIKSLHGGKASAWIGNTITLGVRYLDKAFGDTNVPTIRVIAPDGHPIPKAALKFYGSATPIGS